MTVPDLNLGPQKGPSGKLQAVVTRELTEADVASLASGRTASRPPMIERLRDRHHALARCLAQGMTDVEASAVTGYGLTRIGVLKKDPTFVQLLSEYRKANLDIVADFHDRATVLSLTALEELQERIESNPEEFSTQMLLEVTKVTADRTGHAPVQKSVNLNVSAQFGDRLAAARRRRAEAQSGPPSGDMTPLIEGEVIVPGE